MADLHHENLELMENTGNENRENIIISNSTYKSEGEKEYPTILDKITCEYGYGIEVWKIIICVTFIYAIDGYSGTIYATMITAYTKQFSLSDAEISLIGVTYFLIKAIGAFFAGSLTKYLNGRVLLLQVCCFVLLTTNLFLSLILTKEMLYVERILSGLASGIIEPLMNNLMCEYLPIKLRGFTLLAVWTGYNLGQLYPNLIMIVSMPHFEPEGISRTLLLSTSLMLVCSIVCFFYLKDSPRNYILHNRNEEGLIILEKLTPEKKISEEEKKEIIKELKQGVNEDISASSPWDVFKNEFLLLTICVSVISFISDFIYDGPVLIMNLTFTALRTNLQEDTVLRKAIIVILFTIPSSIIGGISFEIKLFGRRRTMFMSFIFLITSLVFGLIFTDYLYIFLGIYQFFANYCAAMAAIYASEVFPSKIRDFSVGLSVFFSNLGSALSQYVFIALHSNAPFTPYYFTIGCCVLGCIFCCLLSVETYQMPLDVYGTKKGANILDTDKSKNTPTDDEKVNLLTYSD